MNDEASSSNKGIQIIHSYVKTLSSSPGIYRMLDAEGKVLYVGKAKNLKKRVMSYTRPNNNTVRIQRMVSLTRSMEFAITHTEAEALLLEVDLIKSLKPRFNILFRDDKSFPYILLTEGELPSRLVIHRGAKSVKGVYFGPFASTQSVHTTVDFLARVFKLRTCRDSVFAPRTRPCLQYHIKRCTAPCVKKVSWADYQLQVEQARQFLLGKTSELQKDLARRMDKASKNHAYEQAGLLRNQIQALTMVQGEQSLAVVGYKAMDVVALIKIENKAAIQIFFYRNGCNYGNRAYYPEGKEAEEGKILQAFVSWFYGTNTPPPYVLLSHPLPEREVVEEAISQLAGSKISFVVPKRGIHLKLMQQALHNAQEALLVKVAANLSNTKLMEELQMKFGLAKVPKRIEVYDNSHFQGKDAFGVMIVATPEGFEKKSYRKFKIKHHDPSLKGGDDYAMMREVLSRRFSNADKSNFPDLVILDGGKGQLSTGLKVMQELGVMHIPLVAIAKGPERNAGREQFFLPNQPAFILPLNDPLLHYLQRLRDESHRFAIGTHRQKRQKSVSQSRLDDIHGIGIKRKRDLLQYFGSLQAISEAGISDLKKVNGIDEKIAEIIYNFFH